jgi:TonB-dependent starch-binding outer membrane protein SusC
MHSLLPRPYLIRKGRGHLARVVGSTLMLTLLLCGTAVGQQARVSGFVSTADGTPVAGVIVGVQKTSVRTTTDVAGRYSVTVPTDGVLVFSAIGFRALAVSVSGRTTVDVVMERAVAVLDEIIVTGYTEQRRADVTGAVSSADMGSVNKESSTSVLQRLDGAVSGVTVEASGSPGSRTTVRVRGVGSFQNNDPLYIIDGTPTEDTYLNWLNPNDIQSIQVLKDASAASIYGSRASNGVVIIETKKTGRGGAGGPVLSIDSRLGVSSPVRGYDDFLILDALEYHEIVKRSYENAGLPVPENIYGDPDSPTIPAYIWPNNGTSQTTGVDEASYSFPNSLIMPGSPGTNWWDAVFGRGLVSDVNLGLAGGGVAHAYNVSFNYLNQEGTSAFNRFQRASLRVNTEFERGRFTVGENVAVSQEQYFGGMGDPGGYAEDGIMGKNILMQPVVPVYDIGGNFAAGKAVGLGNQSNPLKAAWANKDDLGKNLKVFGNAFAGFRLMDGLQVETRLGFNRLEQEQHAYNPISPELSEPSFSDGITENYYTFTEWSWANTLLYAHQLGDRHNFNALLGQAASANEFRANGSGINNLLTTDINARYIQDAIGDAASKNVSSSGGKGAILSYFGKVDYNFAERYYLSATLRRDGSSRLGPDSRWGTFPAFSFGWRLSKEGFLAQSQFFTNVMLRFGYGVTGNQAIPAGRIVSQFGGDRGDTYYDVGGSNTIAAGYRQTSLGNPDLKWEENRSTNLGLDLEFLGGAANLVLDVYQRSTDNLLFDPQTPGTAGIAAPPIVNVGEMKNRGIDLSLGYTGTIGSGNWRVSFNGSHYRNEIVRIDGVQDFFYGPVATRFGNQVINQVGHPIGSFYGLEADGFFENDAAVTDHATQDGAAPGRLRFVDQLTVDTDDDGVPDEVDGVINADDRVIVGSPHPDFTAGLDMSLEIGAFDFFATVFGSFGNEIWDVQKEFYVFRNFSTNVRRDLLTDSWTPENTDAKYPRLDVNDTFSGQQLSSYYVEDGSYVRLRTLQIGYRIPEKWIPNTRVYVQAENLFTLTGYSGLDPTLPAANIFGAAGDIRDQYRGVDRGSYPSNKTLSFGVSTRF